MKRASSRELPALYDAAGLSARQKRHSSASQQGQKGNSDDLKSGIGGTRPNAPRPGRGLASGSLGSAGGAASSGGGSGSVARGQADELPEVCSPPPKRPLGTLPDMPTSPFAAASLAVEAAAPPWQRMLLGAGARDSRQQLAQRGPCSTGSLHSSIGEESDGDASEDDQENHQPCGCTSGAPAAPGTWLFSPVKRPDGRAARGGGGGGGTSTPRPPPRPSSAPHRDLSPLLSPTLCMSTPPKEALPTAPPAAPERERGAPTLTHAPSFTSWLVPAACRPPSPPAPPSADVADVLASLEGDCRVARGFEGGQGPSHLDRLLAELGDTHYPASLLQWEQEELADSEGERA